jgi:hypothetical protein
MPFQQCLSVAEFGQDFVFGQRCAPLPALVRALGRNPLVIKLLESTGAPVYMRANPSVRERLILPRPGPVQGT